MLCHLECPAIERPQDCVLNGQILANPDPNDKRAASVVLEVGEDDTIWAVGVLGKDRFHDYFKTFKPEMKEFYGGKRASKKLVSVSAKTVVLTEYTKEIIQY